MSSVQREGYLTYAATLEVVGRQQVGLPTTFAEDYQCMRRAAMHGWWLKMKELGATQVEVCGPSVPRCQFGPTF